MPEIIRTGVFETNSSSTHSISIDESVELLDTLPVDDTGRITLTGGEFGWGPSEHTDALTKANYIATDYSYSEDYSILTEVIKEQTGCTEVVYDMDKWCYIDHQSSGTGRELSKDELRQFIFNPKSTLYISNDN
jgi:hypothetical protein